MLNVGTFPVKHFNNLPLSAPTRLERGNQVGARRAAPQWHNMWFHSTQWNHFAS